MNHNQLKKLKEWEMLGAREFGLAYPQKDGSYRTLKEYRDFHKGFMWSGEFWHLREQKIRELIANENHSQLAIKILQVLND